MRLYPKSRVPHVIGKTTPCKYDRYITLMHSSFQETSGRKRSDIISNIKTWRFELFPFCAFWSQFGCFVKSLHNVQLTGITEGWRPGKDSEAAKVCDEGTFLLDLIYFRTTSKLSDLIQRRSTHHLRSICSVERSSFQVFCLFALLLQCKQSRF